MDDQNTTQNLPSTPPQSPISTSVPEVPKKSSGGPVVAVVIIIALLILGGLYFWGAQLKQEADEQLPFILGDTAMQQEDANSSDDLGDISADFQTADEELSSMDADIETALKGMDAELNASTQ